MACQSQYGITYAVHIISSHFGDLVAKVCKCLLGRGPLTFHNIVRFTELSSSQVKNCLLVLIQQNCVQAFSEEREGGIGDASKRTSTAYMAVFDNIIHRTRFPKFLAVVSQELDKECEELFRGLLEHGRLTLEKMIDRATSGQGNAAGQDSVRQNLFELVSARFVERCPAPEPHLAPRSEEEAPVKKRGPKSPKIVTEVETLEQRVLAAAAPMESKRFLLMTDTNMDENGDKSEEASVGVGEKRKYEALDKQSSGNDEHGVLWRVNFEEFLHRFRHKACIENVRERFGDGTAVALNAMLEASRRMEMKVKAEYTVPLSINTIYEEVMKAEAGRAMTFDHLRASLAELGCARGADDSYRIDLKNIIEQAQNEEVESIVLKKYGQDAHRIFRYLLLEGRLLETDKIADTAFVDKNETPKILCSLWKDEFLHMEKISVSAVRQTQFLLWKINKSTMKQHFLDDLYHAALNLSQRVAYELEQESEILQLPVEKRIGPVEVRYNRLRNVRFLLESSLMKLDDAIMLFHNF